ncbi:ABC transporter permease subunit [Thermomonospora cellulosilytica]|uniref:ABC-type transport system involved in multi-copper enzyme maturation permease subunit n=1 Tax=Thermomonospora cellulosilytica TaxID=1411118 RepID=A0A7W3R9T5_9ACTN|nr:ABC transporter permease subunit [Thermomonospora cellulosilytica]MBA9005713.1 ABC-type transport system involved in multi-copper enzyme maturation permease subunit [Thermomonospora cellulosilytica]
MIWLNWRQFRLQALVAAVVLALIAVYLLHLGGDIRDAHDAYRSGCGNPGDCAQAKSQFQSTYQNTLLFLAAGLGLLPVVIGAFWGAPLIARELETGTHRLVWNQSVTRRRWLLGRMAFVGLAAMLLTGLASLLLTWAASPYDQVAGDRFGTVEFGARNIAPLGYAVLAFTLGTVIGLLVRRTLPAMAITGVVFLVLQFAVPNLVRPHLMPPEKTTLPMTAETINQARNLGSITGAPVIGGLEVPGAPDAWISEISPMRTADGRTLSETAFNACLNTPPETGAGGTFGDAAVCLAKLNLHVDIRYQPSDRYWAFQLSETALYVALSGILIAFGLRRIRRA